MSLTFFSTTAEHDSAPLVSFTVYGKPEPQGSVKAFVPTYKSGQPVRRDGGQIVVNLTSDNPALKKWRKGAQQEAGEAMQSYGESVRPAREGAPVRVEATFYLQRPKSHYGTGRNANVVKASAPAYPVGRPDVDKLLRALLDALTNTVVADDSQVVEVLARKVYCGPHDEPRVEVSVFALTPTG
jgi:Holliday junction resolvase RusA-like endonuclease